jgi:hypothetical protein
MAKQKYEEYATMLDEFELKQRYNDYQREVRRAVRQEQLYQQVKAHQSNQPQGMLMRLGDLLIMAGQHLKAKNDSQTDFQQV